MAEGPGARKRRLREERDARDAGLREQRRRRRLSPEGRRRAAAREAVAKALRSGALVRPGRCERCGAGGRIEAHHPDYDRPLDVEWRCLGCHKDVHPPPWVA